MLHFSPKKNEWEFNTHEERQCLAYITFITKIPEGKKTVKVRLFFKGIADFEMLFGFRYTFIEY